MSLWQLPQKAVIGGQVYDLHTDYRDILEIISYLDDPDKPVYLRWRIAIALFFEQEVPEKDYREAMEYLAEFISNGDKDRKPAHKLLDWQQDAAEIISGINKVAGKEIREEKYIHWWTFLGWFYAIGEGSLQTIVSIRDKLRRGKKLEKWENEFYRQNKERVDLKTRFSKEELEEQERLKKLLGE